MRRHLLGAAAVLVALGATGCGAAASDAAEPTPIAADATSAAPEAKQTESSHWSYDGANGPDAWADLDPSYAACGDGRRQSPIAIPEAQANAAAPLEGLELSYGAAPGVLFDDGHTVQIALAGRSNIIHVDGKDFTLVRMQFHAHAEHVIGTKAPSPLELHLVHEAADGSLAVVGVLFKEGAENAALAEAFSKMPSATSDATALDATIDPMTLVPADRKGWAYSGSLTTPPCTEGVRWFVHATELEVSAAQLAAFTERHGHSFRPTEPLNARIVSNGNLPHWDYGDVDEWGDLSPSTVTCKTGTQQSPVDIPSSLVPGSMKGVVFSYAPAPIAIFDNGHTVQVGFTGGSNAIRIEGKTYRLVQYHFHEHSEHTVGGVAYPLEVHLVHQSDDGKLAVIGSFIDAGATNAALSEVFGEMAHATDVPAPLPSAFDPSVLIPPGGDGWTYDGSLTTPPCSEGVKWHVFAHPLEASPAQIAAFPHPGSARRVQPLGSRALLGGTP